MDIAKEICLIATKDSLAFYVIAQGRFHKNDICQINFGKSFLSSPYVLSVGIIFCHIRNNPA